MSIEKLLTSVDDESLQHALNNLKLEPHVDDDLVKLEILAARKDVIGQVGSRLDDFFDDNPEFEMAVLIEVFTLYNNRDSDSTADIFQHPAFHSLIESMKDSYREIIHDYGDDYSVDEGGDD